MGLFALHALYRSIRRGKSLAEVVAACLADSRDRAEKAKRGRLASYASFERLLAKHVLPRLGAMQVIEIDEEMVRNLHQSLHETPVEANRMLTASV